jgi:P-type E1-E2 ATPase
MAAQSVAMGARVRPGERIALDGRVVSGSASVNQAPITGESLPVDKETGDSVFASTINTSGSFEYTVSALVISTPAPSPKAGPARPISWRCMALTPRLCAAWLMAVFADVGASLLVVANGMRMLRR